MNQEWGMYIRSIIQVVRETQIYDTKQKKYVTSREDAVYLANHAITSEDAYRRIRCHWFIENKDHHVRDETLGEDYSRIRVNPGIMSKLRSFALNILRKNKVGNINIEIYENSLDYNRLYSYKQFI